MLIWGVVWGAIVGLLWPGWDSDAWLVGAALGLAAGWSLRRAVRTVVRREIAAARPARTVPADQATAPDWANDMASDAASGAPTVPLTPAPASARSAAATAARADLHTDADASTDDDTDSFFPATVPHGGMVASAEPRPPRAPAPPSPLQQGLAWLRDWLTQGNPIVKAGLAILFVGLSFLARYAAQAGLLPVELRLAAIGAVGVALLALGFRQRAARPGFGLALQGGGVAVLYLTVFAAFRLYGLVPQLPALALMVLVCAGGCALALLQNSRALAFMAFAGGFAAPLLLSTGGGSHVGLFGYYALLNLAILFIATRRAWRALNLLGFVATFGVAAAWGGMRYGAEHYASAQAFLLLFVAIFITTAILYARATPLRLGLSTTQAVDTTLVFGTALAGFGLQAGLAQPFLYGEAFSALGFGAVYVLLAAALLRRGPHWRVLGESFLALGVGFATLAVPLALDARWTSAVWALEGAAAFWVGRRQARWMPRAFGLLLQALAGLSYFGALGQPTSRWPLAHAGFLGALLIALPAVATAWWARQPLAHSGSRWAAGWARLERLLPTPLLFYGLAMWLQAWSMETIRWVPGTLAGDYGHAAWSASGAQWLLAGVALLSFAALLGWGRRTAWPAATWPSRLSLPVLALTLLAQWLSGLNVLSWPAWLCWPLALALHLALLRRAEPDAAHAPGPAAQRWSSLQHSGTVWLVVLLLADALASWAGRSGLWGTAWASVAGVVAAMAVLLALTRWAGRAGQAEARSRFAWPLNPHAPAYYWRAAAPLALGLWLGAFALAWTSSGRTAPLPYVPLLNPTDLAVLLAIGALLLWRRTVLAATPRPAGAAVLAHPAAWGALGLLGLVALSTLWLRVAHHYFGVPWDAGALYDSFVVQTGYAILWTLTALALMLAAHRRGLRPAWLAGAALLALVVAKLILVDLSNRGGGERIIAFIGVGVLMLVVGYFAPLPPKKPAPPQENA
jgi:uncharacterized membrane protein